jgi:hypothetical protein
MAKKFYTDINLLRNELQNAAIQNLAEAPQDPVLGQIYFSTTDNEVYICANTEGPVWESMGGDVEEVIAGLGLTGGGDDNSVTLDIGEGTGITVNDDDIQIRNAENLTEDKVTKWDATNGQLVDTIITDTGTNVGIGNNTPAYKLDVAGDIATDGDIYLNKVSPFANPKIYSQGSILFYIDSESSENNYVYQFHSGANPLITITEAGDMGVGTTSPSAGINLYGDQRNIKVQQSVNGDVFSGIEFSAFNSGSSRIEASLKLNQTTKEFRLFTRDEHFPTFYSNNVEAMRIDVDGNVGIGTTTPSEKLEVTNNIKVGVHLIGVGASTNTDNLAIGEGAMAADAGDGSLALGKNSLNVSTGAAVVGLGEDTLRYSPDASYALSVGTAAGMRDNGPQNVFVGPYAGPYYTELTGGYNTIIGTLAGINIEGAAERNVGLGQSALGDLTTGERNTAVGQQALPTVTTGSRNIALGQGSGNLLTTGSDNILIGNNEQGIETGSYNVLIGKISGLATDLANTIILSDGEGNERMRVDSTGNVGIGTTSPNYKLEVQGTLGITEYLYHSGDNNTYLRFSGDRIIFQAGGYEMLRLIEGATSEVVINEGSQDLNFRVESDTDTHALFVQGSDGRVGIGTSTPSADLHLVGELLGNTDGDSLTHVTVEGERHHLDIKEVRTATLEEQDWKNTTLKLQLRVDSTNHQSIDFVSDDSFQEHIDILTGNQLFNTRFTADGKVGIGTNSPSQKLHVSGGNILLDSQYGVRFNDGNTRIYTNNDSPEDLIIEADQDLLLNPDGNVGIGTSTPSAKLEVFGTGNTLRLDSDANGSKEILFRNVGTGTATIKTDGDLKLYTEDAGKNILFDTTGGEKMRITADGNVGIGTTSPSQKLHVVGKALITDDVQLTGSNPRIDFNSNGTSSLRFYDTDAALERMRINESGNIGIGDSAPSFILDVNNTSSRIRFKANTGDSNLELSAIAGRDWLIQSKADGEFRIYDEDAAAVRFNIDASGNIQLPAYTAGYLKSDASGNITVDSDTIEDTLDSVTTRGNTTTNDITVNNVIANANVTSANNYLIIDSTDNDRAVMALDAANNLVLQTGTSSGSRGIVFRTEGSERMRISHIGYVGIGTTIPLTTLHSYSTQASPILAERNIENGNVSVQFKDQTSSWYAGKASNGNFGISRSANLGASTVFNITSTDNIGIGTSSPAYKLEVNADSSSGVMSVKNAANDRDTFRSENAAGTRTFNVGNDSSGHGILILRNSSGTVTSFIKGSGDSYFNGGNVGIGTASPSEKLHVVGDTRIEGNLTVNGTYTQIDTDTNTTEQWNVTNDGTGPAVTINQTGAQDIMDVQDDGTSVFYIEDGGNVGIGTTDPNDLLQVGRISGGNASLSIASGGTSSSTLFFRRSTTFDAYIQVDANEDLLIGYNSANLGDNLKIISNTTNVATFDSDGALKLSQYGSNTFTGTAAYALAVDSSGNIIETAVQGSPTGGSGTAGKLTKWDTSSTLTDSVITESGDNLGIGVAPKTGGSTWQHIQFGGTGNIIARKSDSGVDAMFANNYYINSSNADSHIITGAATRMFLNDGEIRFDTAPSAAADAVATFTNRMFIANGGNVGIGTTTISGQEGAANGTPKLQVLKTGTTGSYDLVARFGTNQDENNSGASVLINGGNDRGLLVSAGRADSNRAIAHLNLIQYDGNELTDGLTIYQPSTGSSGATSGTNIGIGTTSPSEKLTVAGNVRLANNGKLYLWNDHNVNFIDYRQWRTSSSVGMTIENQSSTGHVKIVSNGNTGVYVNNDGNVGIGTTSPSGIFHSYISANRQIGHNAVGGDLGVISDNNSAPVLYVKGTGTADLVNIFDDTTEVFTILDGGNVGIGTTSPAYKLDVNGTAHYTGNVLLDDNVELRLGTDSDFKAAHTGTYSYMYNYTGHMFIRNFANDSDIIFQTDDGSGGYESYFTLDGSTGHAYFSNYGNVGIGTSSPNAPLHIQEAVDSLTTVKGITLSTSAGGTNKYLPAIVWSYGANGTPDFAKIEAQRGGGTSGRIAFSTANNSGTMSETMRIDGDGNVGIGTTSPVTKLDVNGATRIGGKTTYTKGYGSLNTTGNAVAGLGTSFNGASARFVFEMHGGAGGEYQRVVYSCYNAGGNWYPKKVIDEGTNGLDVTASSNGTTITFTFKARTASQAYSPYVTIEHVGAAIDISYL